MSALVSTTVLAACTDDDSLTPLPAKLVIAHRGASALRPEHTIAAYTKAIEDGANVIEPDLVATQDGQLVARHENEISGTTNVAEKAEFAGRMTTKTIDGVAFTGWFTEDFTLAELKTLRAKERIPAIRPANTAFDGQFEIPTLQEVINLAKAKSSETGRTIAIYPETKHPSYFQGIGLALEPKLLKALADNGYAGDNAAVFIQSFEVANLKAMRLLTDLRLVQLIGSPTAKPYDFVLSGDTRTYADLITPAGLTQIATYADGLGPPKDLIIPRKPDGTLATPTTLVSDAHTAGLIVHPYTFRPENSFLPTEFKSSAVASERGNLVGELDVFIATGIDGFFVDDPAIGRTALDTP